MAVPRETIYASWNRGCRASSACAIGFWNVDDYRNPSAIVEGVELVRQGHSVIRFPWVYVKQPAFPDPTRDRVVVFHDRDALAGLDPRGGFCLGPFFMFDRRLFEEYGPFDEQLHIAGDYDWQLRVVPEVGLTSGTSVAGVFFTDGRNLSGTGSARLHVEENVLFRRHGLERLPWPLDSRARRLLAHYSVDEPSQAAPARDWTYDERWLGLDPWLQICRRGRRLAGTPLRMARARKSRVR